MIKQGQVADPHAVAHEITRLVIAHAEPGHHVPGRGQHIVDTHFVRFGLHQPIGHGIDSVDSRPRDACKARAHKKTVAHRMLATAS
jgi:hypothetical protein